MTRKIKDLAHRPGTGRPGGSRMVRSLLLATLQRLSLQSFLLRHFVGQSRDSWEQRPVSRGHKQGPSGQRLAGWLFCSLKESLRVTWKPPLWAIRTTSLGLEPYQNLWPQQQAGQTGWFATPPLTSFGFHTISRSETDEIYRWNMCQIHQ